MSDAAAGDATTGDAAAAEAARGEVAAAKRLVTLVHDLRTPLTVVSGFADLLEERGEALPPERRAEFVSRIAEGARELRAILDRERAERRAG